MAALGQFRGDTNANWISTNPILADREFILVKMSENSPWSHVKFGNGVDTYNKLPLLPLVAVQEIAKELKISKIQIDNRIRRAKRINNKSFKKSDFQY